MNGEKKTERAEREGRGEGAPLEGTEERAAPAEKKTKFVAVLPFNRETCKMRLAKATSGGAGPFTIARAAEMMSCGPSYAGQVLGEFSRPHSRVLTWRLPRAVVEPAGKAKYRTGDGKVVARSLYRALPAMAGFAAAVDGYTVRATEGGFSQEERGEFDKLAGEWRAKLAGAVPKSSAITPKEQEKVDLHKFFNTISDEKKAHILGFCLAESYLWKTTEKTKGGERVRKRFGIEIARENDASGLKHLEEIKNIIGSENKILMRVMCPKCKKKTNEEYVRERRQCGNEHCKAEIDLTKDEYRYVRLEFDSEGVVNDLLRLGVRGKGEPRKFPDKEVPEQLRRHVIRGLWDGDGTLALAGDGSKDWYFNISGSKPLLEEVQKELIRNCGVGKVTIFDVKDEKSGEITTWRLQYKGNEQVPRIMRWLYQSASIKHEGKYKKYLEMCRQLGRQP